MKTLLFVLLLASSMFRLQAQDFMEWQANVTDYTQVLRTYDMIIAKEAVPPASAYYNRGIVKSKLDDPHGAISDFTQVILKEPDHADALKNKAIVEQLLEQQQQEEQEEQEQQEQEEQEQSEAEAESEENQEESEPQLDDEQQEEDQEPQQPQEQETPEQDPQDAETEDSQKNQRSENTEFEEDQESLEQFLRRIEDNPGELLQRKFQFESRRRLIERRAANQGAR